ncbi:MAG: capsid protein [CRESS virus sp. ctrF513]|nr:MAG: capsid protein [CRESS virus sp. ctrF513]
MSYKRRYKKKRSRFGRFLRGAAKTAMVASTALRVAKQVKGLVNVEYKKRDLAQSESPDNATLSVAGLCSIGQGDTDQARNGNEVRAKGIQFRLSLSKHSTATNTMVRIMLLRCVDGGTPTVNILENVGTYRCLAPKASQYANQFITIKEWTVVLNQTTPIKIINYYKKLNHHIKWYSTGSTDFKSGSYCLAMLSNEATYLPNIIGYSRIRFIDN